MSIVDTLKNLCDDTASWEPLTGRDRAGAPTYGSATAFTDCRLVRAHKLVRDRNGDQVISSAQLWIMEDPGPEIDPDDQVTLSDGTKPPIITVQIFQGRAGASYTKVFFR